LEAKALIYIGNSGGNSKSSKYLEYISWKKPIVGINVETDNEVRKYKYYFDEKDPDLILKLNKIVKIANNFSKEKLLPFEKIIKNKAGNIKDK
jgi:hypothetical protein